MQDIAIGFGMLLAVIASPAVAQYRAEPIDVGTEVMRVREACLAHLAGDAGALPRLAAMGYQIKGRPGKQLAWVSSPRSMSPNARQSVQIKQISGLLNGRAGCEIFVSKISKSNANQINVASLSQFLSDGFSLTKQASGSADFASRNMAVRQSATRDRGTLKILIHRLK